jgi:hypothetical protein
MLHLASLQPVTLSLCTKYHVVTYSSPFSLETKAAVVVASALIEYYID